MDTNNKSNRIKSVIRFIVIALAIFVIGGLGAVTMENYVFPRLSATQLFSKYKFLQKAGEKTTIISKTEQVVVKEDDSVNQIASQAATAVVNIISVSEKKQKILESKEAFLSEKGATGILVTSDGLIVTYRAAIIEKDARYTVFTYDGVRYSATLVGIDEFTNLAYLKIDASNLPAVSFANSSDFQPGKKLIAVGNSPGEYQNRFAAGLLSNINKTFNIAGKTVSSSEKLEGVFETDFENQTAYLGGPIINYNGELVGVIGSVLIDNREHFFQIPANAVRRSLELAIKNELANRPVLGIYYVPITKEYAIVNNLARDRGALIFSSSGKEGLAIITGSPAEKAGLQINDIIIAVTGQEVNLDNPLSNLLSQYKKGEEVELLVLRENREIKIKVDL
ncbi:MAG: S1C family serine protease [Candidatus Moranbacteria bacterium]|nr:S1C family serine protease [Candidatus Moranbacteria bacterium]